MEILKPEELKEKFSDPWVAPYEKVLTMVDGDKVEIGYCINTKTIQN